MTHHLIRKLLIANRGEIACRITRTCRSMGITSVAVYSEADAQARHVTCADEAVYLGGRAAGESYLNIERILEAARRTGADAVHPGYGFLAENAAFAQAVQDAGLTWIGPPPSAIDAMGRKREAKALLEGVPLVPGYGGEAQDDATLIDAANNVGYPIMLKASAGGGGKGMRRVDDAGSMPDALESARREARGAFGDDTLIIEKLIEQPRHVEIQVFGDTHGTVIALGERECSVQRRHQKIIEETPSPAVDPGLRARMSEAAVKVGQQLGYVGAGTVEFLLDADGNFYFMEMNTRLQVEHPVTEMVYPAPDLVELGIRVAEGERLPEFEVVPNGHAIEARVYAEDPSRDFLPVSGHVLLWEPPDIPHVRVDDGIRTSDTVTVDYDPMLAKVIAWGRTRTEAIRRLDYALGQTRLLGFRHNIGFLRHVLTHPDHLRGEISTGFLAANPGLNAVSPPLAAAFIAAALSHPDYPAGGIGWRNNPWGVVHHTFSQDDTRTSVEIRGGKQGQFAVCVNDRQQDVTVFEQANGQLDLAIDGHRLRAVVRWDDLTCWVHVDGHAHALTWINPLPQPDREVMDAGSLRAPMPGQVVSVSVSSGKPVKAGDSLMVLEAMKMEHRILAPYDGIIQAVYYANGDSVPGDAVLLEIAQDGAEDNES